MEQQRLEKQRLEKQDGKKDEDMMDLCDFILEHRILAFLLASMIILPEMCFIITYPSIVYLTGIIGLVGYVIMLVLKRQCHSVFGTAVRFTFFLMVTGPVFYFANEEAKKHDINLIHVFRALRRI